MAKEAERELRSWRYGDAGDDNGSNDDDEPEETRRPTRQPSYRPTYQPTDAGPTPRPPTPRPRPSSDCPPLEPLPRDSDECPDELDIEPCDTPGLGVGELCEGDGECGTDRKLDNCSNDEAQGADIYRIVGGTPNYQPTKRPTTDCPSGITDEYGNCVDEGCASWYDGCNTCSVRDGSLDACTEMYCETPEEPKCLDSDANGCADDPTWCYGDCSPNDCAYVGQKVKPDGTLARCKKKNTDGERSALEACPATCGTCP